MEKLKYTDKGILKRMQEINQIDALNATERNAEIENQIFVQREIKHIGDQETKDRQTNENLMSKNK